jgi:hypothetical protein
LIIPLDSGRRFCREWSEYSRGTIDLQALGYFPSQQVPAANSLSTFNTKQTIYLLILENGQFESGSTYGSFTPKIVCSKSMSFE